MFGIVLLSLVVFSACDRPPQNNTEPQTAVIATPTPSPSSVKNASADRTDSDNTRAAVSASQSRPPPLTVFFKHNPANNTYLNNSLANQTDISMAGMSDTEQMDPTVATLASPPASFAVHATVKKHDDYDPFGDDDDETDMSSMSMDNFVNQDWHPNFDDYDGLVNLDFTTEYSIVRIFGGVYPARPLDVKFPHMFVPATQFPSETLEPTDIANVLERELLVSDDADSEDLKFIDLTLKARDQAEKGLFSELEFSPTSCSVVEHQGTRYYRFKLTDFSVDQREHGLSAYTIHYSTKREQE